MQQKAVRFLLVVALLAAPLVFPRTSSQASSQESHEVTVVNITVPVRVFDGDRFVDSLKLEDFALLEDGRPQSVQAVYLIRGKAIERHDGPLPAASAPPPTARHFVLLFQLTEYLPEVVNAVDYFFDNVVRSGDGVDIVTPRTTYRLKAKLSSKEALNKAKREVGAKVRQDVLVDSGAYNAIIKDLIDNLGGSSDPEYSGVNLQGYALNLQRLEWLRTIEPERMAAFAAELKKIPGAKHVFLFFQKERVPQLSNKVLFQFMSGARSDEVLQAMELMGTYSREIKIDTEAIRKTFADASTDVHFLYVTRTRRDEAQDVERQSSLENVTMAEHSEDIYSAFREIAAATGGTSDASWNAVNMLKKAAAASENYYLVYYRPQDYKADGNYHAITVKVKTGGYRVTHRAGYFATEKGSAPAAPEAGAQAAPAAAQTAAGAKVITPTPSSKPAQPKSEPGQAARSANENEVLEPLGAPPAQTLLAAAADYCRRLQDAALYFVCKEEVRERLGMPVTTQSGVVTEGGAGPSSVTSGGGGRVSEWTYDYQLIRREGKAEETRTLLKENGGAKHEENAKLGTSRFSHSNVILGPIGLLSAAAQRLHDYGIVKELETDGEAVVIIDVRPKSEAAASLYGKAWVRRRDGAVLKIEWVPASLGNYEEILKFARQRSAVPRLSFASEYAFEKNGLRFPSGYSVTEAYVIAARSRIASITDVTYKDYKFFMVRTEVKY